MSIHRGLATSKNREMLGDIEPVIPQRGEKRKSPEETLESRVARNTLCDSHNTISGEGVGFGSKTIDPHSPITKKHTIEFHQWQKGYIDRDNSGKAVFLSEACKEFNLLYHIYDNSSDEEVKNKLANELFSNNLVKLVFKDPSILPQLEKDPTISPQIGEKLDPLAYSIFISIIINQASKNEAEFINIIKQNPRLFKEISNDAWHEISEETRAIIQEIFVQHLVDNPKDIQHIVKCDTIDMRNINNWSCQSPVSDRLYELKFPHLETIPNLFQDPEGFFLSAFNSIMKDEEAFKRALEHVDNCARHQEKIIAAVDLNNLDSLTDDQLYLFNDQCAQRGALENNPKLFAKVNNLDMNDDSFPLYYLLETSIAKYVEKNPEITFKELQERLTSSEKDSIEGLTKLMRNVDVTNQHSDQLRNLMYEVVFEPFLDSLSLESLCGSDRYADYQSYHVSNQEVLAPILKEAVTRNPLLLNDFRAFVRDSRVFVAACIQKPELLQLVDGAMMAIRVLQELADHAGHRLTVDDIISHYSFLSDKVKHDKNFWKFILKNVPKSIPRLLKYLPNEIKQSREKLFQVVLLAVPFMSEETKQQLQEDDEIANMMRQLQIIE